MAHCFLATMLVMMASGMPLLVTAGTQSDNAANANTIDSWALKTTQQQQQQSQQQQQQQPQPNSQQQQQNLAPDLYAFLDKINFPSKSPLSNTKEFLQHSVDSGDLVSKLGDDSGLNQNYVFYLNNDKIPDLLQANGGNAESNTYGNRESLNGKSVFTSANEPFSSHYFPEEEYTEIPTKAGSSFFQGKGQIYSFDNDDMGLAEDKRGAPMFVGRRDQTNDFKSDHYSPYNHIGDVSLWKGIDFPASFMTEVPKMAKGRMSNGSVLNLSGKRGPPRFVGKREPVFEAFTDGSSILEHKRGPPRFVGKREYLLQSFLDGSSLLDHKRAAPKFVGKRKLVLDSFSDGDSMLEYKRGAPRFVGKRGVPFFVGKRPLSELYRPDVASLKYSADGTQRSHENTKPTQAIDLQDQDIEIIAPVSNEDSGPIAIKPEHVDRGIKPGIYKQPQDANGHIYKLATGNGKGTVRVVNIATSEPHAESMGHSLSKRFSEFVGKRVALEDESTDKNAEAVKLNQKTNEDLLPVVFTVLPADQYENDENEQDTLKKRVYDFVGKRSYDFVGKRSYDFVGKRYPYDFVGKRSSYDFVGKRSPYDFVGKRSPYDFVGKKSSYDFVGKRSPYDFVGKRSPYDFVGKRSPYDFVGKRSPYDFVGKRSSYHFVGKRSPNDFVGKRSSYDFVGKRSPYDFVGKRSPYDFVGKRSPYDFVGKRSLYDFVGKRSPYDFVGKRSSYDFVGKRSPYDFVGKRSSYEFVGKRSPSESDTKAEQNSDVLENSHTLTLSPTDSEYMKEGFVNHTPQHKSESTSEAGETVKRYTEFLGKKKRAEEEAEEIPSDSHRFAELLQSNGFRKRLSKILFSQKLADQYPEFIGKRDETKDE